VGEIALRDFAHALMLVAVGTRRFAHPTNCTAIPTTILNAIP
jgi:hypothetical protein